MRSDFSFILAFSCLFFLVPGTGFAQEEMDEGKTYNIKVRNPGLEILVEEHDSVMYTDHANKLRISVSGKNRLGAVYLEGGEISRNGNNFIATVKAGTECLLVVYIIKPNGSIEMGLSKTYKIIHLKDPFPLIGGVKHDSIIYRSDLLLSDFLYGSLDRFNKTYRIKIISFEMNVWMDTLEVQYKSIGDRFSPAMRRYVQTLKPGVPLNFRQIICLMPDGTPRRLKDMRVFVDCSSKDPGLYKE